MTRLSEDDRKFGPITYASSNGWRPWRMVFSSGGSDDSDGYRNNLTVYAFGKIVRLDLPNLVKPARFKNYWGDPNEDTDNSYYCVFPKEYGFSLSDGFFQIFYGPQTHDSKTTVSKSWFLPWTQWEFARHSMYDANGSHFWTQRDHKDWDEFHRAKESVEKVLFEVEDYDGEIVIARTHIEEREWSFGTGYFRWLKWLRPNRISRRLEIEFSEEIGTDKGSWKGGLIATSVDIKPGENHESAFRRFCSFEQKGKFKNYRITYKARL